MKKEGRQHGMVRSYQILPSPLNPKANTRLVNKLVRSHRIQPSPLNPRPHTRLFNKLDSPPTAGLFTRFSYKPTNHSKFTCKCGTLRCISRHLHLACKSKDKTKGTQKIKSNEAVLNAELITCRGFSTSRMLDHLNEEVEAMEDEDEVDYRVKDSYSFADFFHHYL